MPVSEVFEALSAVFRHASFHDPLTGLPNRRMLELRAPDLTRDTHPSRTGILFIDLDDFKGVNDTYSHRAGDAVLAELATRLRGGMLALGGQRSPVCAQALQRGTALRPGLR